MVAKIKDAIAHYGLTAADLGLSAAGSKAPRALKAAKPGRKPGRQPGAKTAGKPTSPGKFTDGQGRTWSGIGKRPDWFKAALAAGKTAEELLIKG